MSKICQKCGYQAEDRMNFCPQCHEKLSASGKIGVSVKKTLSAIKSKMSKKVIIAAIAAVVIVIALVVIFTSKNYDLNNPREFVQMLLDKKLEGLKEVAKINNVDPAMAVGAHNELVRMNIYDSKIVDCVNLGTCAGVGLKYNNPRSEFNYVCLYFKKTDGSWRLARISYAKTHEELLQDKMSERRIRAKCE